MDGAIDIKLLLSLGAMLVSVVSASVIVKQKLATVIDRLNEMQIDYENRLRVLDKLTDKQENKIGLNVQKIDVLSSISSPTQLERQHREMERTMSTVASNQVRITKLESMHNGKHPDVKHT